jgi:hypothetical protein
MQKISRGDAECFSHLQIFMSLTVFSARAFPATEIVFVSRSNGAILFGQHWMTGAFWVLVRASPGEEFL